MKITVFHRLAFLFSHIYIAFMSRLYHIFQYFSIFSCHISKVHIRTAFYNTTLQEQASELSDDYVGVDYGVVI